MAVPAINRQLYCFNQLSTFSKKIMIVLGTVFLYTLVFIIYTVAQYRKENKWYSFAHFLEKRNGKSKK